MQNNIIIIKNLSKAFAGKEVIRQYSMTIEKGSIYGLLGANGAGKTTIFKILSGLIQPSAGMVKIMGMNYDKNKEAILRGIGTMIEMPIFYEHLSAKENLEIHLEYMGVKNANTEKILGQVGLYDTGRQAVSEFSLGMKQRLGIGRAIAHNPKILILDEPINGLDPMGIRQMRELFVRLSRNEGMTILVSSHILSEIEQTADYIGVIADGRLKKESSLDKIKNKYADGLEDYFLDVMNGGQDSE